MNSILCQIGPEKPELHALELGTILAFDFVYTLASTNIQQSAQNLVKMYMAIRSRISSIMCQIGPDDKSYLPLN